MTVNCHGKTAAASLRKFTLFRHHTRGSMLSNKIQEFRSDIGEVIPIAMPLAFVSRKLQSQPLSNCFYAFMLPDCLREIPSPCLQELFLDRHNTRGSMLLDESKKFCLDMGKITPIFSWFTCVLLTEHIP